MKYGIIIIVILLLGVLIYLIPNKIIKKSYKIENVNYFYLSYTKGYAMNSNVMYRINKDLVATIKLYGESDEITINVDKSVLKEIEEVLRKYDIQKWNGFKRRNSMVKDGNSFSLSIEMENGKEIEASGYASKPNNFNIFVEEIDKIFIRIYNENKGD